MKMRRNLNAIRGQAILEAYACGWLNKEFLNVAAWCPYCHKYHFHSMEAGAEFGDITHRGAHCCDFRNKDNINGPLKDGYWLVYRGKASDELYEYLVSKYRVGK